MKKSNVIELAGRAADADPLTEMLRIGARRLIEQAVEAELQELLMAHEDRRLADGRAGVVRNGHLPERDIQTGLGPVTVRIPKVRAKTGKPITFRLPAGRRARHWCHPMSARRNPWRQRCPGCISRACPAVR